MNNADRIATLRNAGFENHVIAAMMGVDIDGVQENAFDPTVQPDSLPDLSSASAGGLLNTFGVDIPFANSDWEAGNRAPFAYKSLGRVYFGGELFKAAGNHWNNVCQMPDGWLPALDPGQYGFQFLIPLVVGGSGPNWNGMIPALAYIDGGGEFTIERIRYATTAPTTSDDIDYSTVQGVAYLDAISYPYLPVA